MLVGKEDCDAIGDTNKYHTDREIDDDDDDDEVIIGDTDLSLPVTDSYGKNSIHDSTIDQSIETVTVGTYDTAGTMSGRNNTKDDDGDTVEGNSNDSSSRIAMKFQPLQPLPGKSISQHCTDDGMSLTGSRTRSKSILINNSATKEGGMKFMNNIQDPVAASKSIRQQSCYDDEFDDEKNLTKIKEAEASDLAPRQLISHTPPTNMPASYETKHFGKRPRAGVSALGIVSLFRWFVVLSCRIICLRFLISSLGHQFLNFCSPLLYMMHYQSLSERLLMSTELEEKGIINRDQKGILKDLIISGQDNEIQHALDRYEQGDATMLEGMLMSGTLSNKATEEIDLLGQLDFDFLNVKEQEDQHQKSQQKGQHNSSNNSASHKSHTTKTGSAASDGIGDLEFNGGIGNWEQGENGEKGRSRSNSTWSALENHARSNSTWSALEIALQQQQQQQQRSRANSAFSIDLDNFRSRSNSLFSPLIGTQTPEAPQANFGRWMETSSTAALKPGALVKSKASDMASEPRDTPPKPNEEQQKLIQAKLHHEHHFQQLLNQQKEKNEQKQKPKSKATKRKSAPSAAVIAKEQLREQKRKERLLKKEQKEKDRQERKEIKERAKQDKQRKKIDVDHHDKKKEREVHLPGSGRPRSFSDPNLNSKVGEDGLLEVERPDGWIGAYSPESRKVRIRRYMEKRNHRVWTKTVKYDVRKNFADSRLRVKGRFVKKDDELLMRELMSLT